MTVEVEYVTFCVSDHDDCPDLDHLGRREAVVLAPQSTDLGKTIKWTPVCSGHLDGWFDGGDDVPLLPYLNLPGKAVDIVGIVGYYQSWLDNHNAHQNPWGQQAIEQGGH